jgi:hypothetical protein
MYELSLPGKQVSIKIEDLSIEQLNDLIEIAIDAENYEMCAQLKEVIDSKTNSLLSNK